MLAIHKTNISAEEHEIEDEDDNITWLNPIQFPTRVRRNIDISLSKTAYPEDCYIRKPDGSAVRTADATTNTNGVTIHDSSDFVSCRVTIGPMDETLTGDWALCGKRTDNSKEQDRCQLVSITLRKFPIKMSIPGLLRNVGSSQYNVY